MTPVVVIPTNYEELSHSERKRIIPICIQAFDRYGHQIAGEWFSRGVAPIRRELVAMAEHTLGDPWCVSELSEATVHRLWARHGHSVGRHPERRVLKKASWIAGELKNGDWKKMKYPNLYLALDSMDEKIRDQTLAEPYLDVERLERQIMLDSIADHLDREGLHDVRVAFQLLRRGYCWREIDEHLGRARTVVAKRRFYRWVKKVGHAYFRLALSR
jgi:hypothetical protein